LRWGGGRGEEEVIQERGAFALVVGGRGGDRIVGCASKRMKEEEKKIF